MLIVETLSRTEVTEKGVYVYSYRMTKGQITLPFEEGSIEVQSYGVEIERQDLVNGVVVNIERDGVGSISPQRHRVHQMLKMLYENSVSPIHLIDIIGEYVDDYIADFDEAFINTATN